MKKGVLRDALIAGTIAVTLASCTPDLAAIQQATVQACGFLPTAVVVAGLFPNPYTLPASAIAQAICAAVATQVPLSTRLTARKSQDPVQVTVNVGGQSYVVSGQFVR